MLGLVYIGCHGHPCCRPLLCQPLLTYIDVLSQISKVCWSLGRDWELPELHFGCNEDISHTKHPGCGLLDAAS